MRASAEVRYEKFQKLIQRIREESENGKPIIVEGNRDRESLRRLGVKGRILCLQTSRKNPLAFVEGLRDGNEFIILTDFDREGTHLANRLSRIIASKRMRGNIILWKELRQITRSELKSVEELPKFKLRVQNQFSHADFMTDRQDGMLP